MNPNDKHRENRRAYVEITTCCNLACAFCPQTKRGKNMMTVAQFAHVAAQIKPLAKRVFLHVMGEPLLHPNLRQIVEVCGEQELEVEIVTNGSRFASCDWEALLLPPVRQVNVSFQAIQDLDGCSQFLAEIFSFTREAEQRRPDLYLNYRVWNLASAVDGLSATANERILVALENEFGVSIPRQANVRKFKGRRLVNRLYLHLDTLFEWPKLSHGHTAQWGSCYGLQSQFGILCDGTVVPCCLDHSGAIPLGNCFVEALRDILESERAKEMMQGFSRGLLVEELCKRCSYVKRFGVKTRR